MFSFFQTGWLADKTVCQVEIREAFPWTGEADGGLRSRGERQKEQRLYQKRGF